MKPMQMWQNKGIYLSESAPWGGISKVRLPLGTVAFIVGHWAAVRMNKTRLDGAYSPWLYMYMID